MKTPRLLLTAACACLAFTASQATTVIPPTFNQLVTQAELIFQGTVTDVASQWVGEGGQRHIVTYVTVNVDDAVKGDPGATYTMRMLGGTVGEETMEISDSPKFKVGDREILFVEHNGTQFIPLVGIMHGRFHLVTNAQTGVESVLTNEGQAVSDLAQLGKADDHGLNTAASANASATALDAAAFKSAIRATLAQSGN
ncbi:MAG: hypothetical protein M3Z22_07320 [Verrucomicrobiota bacterium]|nr:hypothetical protein [Verrucomicrobiota bacterium]